MTTAGSAQGRGRFGAAVGRVGSRPWLLLAPVLLVMLAVPLLGPSFDPNLTGDESGYFRLAENIVHGHYLTGRDDEVTGGSQYPNLWFGPGLPLVMAPLVAIHLPLSGIRLLGPLFLFLAALLFFKLLTLYVSSRGAAIGAAALALYVPFYTALEHLHSETLSVLLVVAMLYGTQRYLHTGNLRYLLLSGVALGWLALTRVAFGWVATVLLVLALLWWALRGGTAPRRFAAVCCLALIVCLPWLGYTYSVTKQPLYWGSSGALSLYWMTSTYPGERGDWQQARAVFRDKTLAPHRPFFRSLIGRSLVAQNDSLLHASVTNVRRDPAGYAKNIVANVSRMWFNFPYSFRSEGMTALLFVIPDAVLLTALLVSIALLPRRPGLLPVEAIPFGLFAVVTFVFHSLLAAYPRMLFPIVPVMIWLVVVVLSKCIRVVPPAASG